MTLPAPCANVHALRELLAPSSSNSCATGYHVSDLLVDGVPMPPLLTYTFGDVQEDHDVHVNFERIQHSIDIHAHAGGSVQGAGFALLYPCGKSRLAEDARVNCLAVREMSKEALTAADYAGQQVSAGSSESVPCANSSDFAVKIVPNRGTRPRAQLVHLRAG